MIIQETLTVMIKKNPDPFNLMPCTRCDGDGGETILSFAREFSKTFLVCEKCKGTGYVNRPVVNRLKKIKN